MHANLLELCGIGADDRSRHPKAKTGPEKAEPEALKPSKQAQNRDLNPEPQLNKLQDHRQHSGARPCISSAHRSPPGRLSRSSILSNTSSNSSSNDNTSSISNSNSER